VFVDAFAFGEDIFDQMKTHVKALVVGGGAVGTSIAYHLARRAGTT
jgi:cation diffusion facilitator CzcD-associated flavoprotein CzcO